MRFLLGLTAVLSTVSALVSRDADIGSSGKMELRILPLGASITYGLQSSNGDGYRNDLRNLLAPVQVTYVGSQCSGSMDNGNNEGHPGFVISQMEGVATPDLEDEPNVVLIYVGTNDMKFGNAEEAPDHMKKLVSFLIDKLPNSLIVVSKLFLNDNPAVQKRIGVYNQQIAGIEKLGNVVVADLSSALSISDLSDDGIHPNDNGYAKMAKVFDAVLVEAEKQGKISSPGKTNRLIKICNGPIATSSQLQTSESTSSGSRLEKETPKPVKSHTTALSLAKTYSSNEENVQSRMSPLPHTTLAHRTSSNGHTSKKQGSTTRATSKPKCSVTSRSKKGSVHLTTSTSKHKEKAKTDPTTASPSSQGRLTHDHTSKNNPKTSSSRQSFFIHSSIPLITGVHRIHDGVLATSQISTQSATSNRDAIEDPFLASAGTETASAAYSTDTPVISSMPTNSIPAINQASTSSLSPEASSAVTGNTTDSANGALASNPPSNFSVVGNPSVTSAVNSSSLALSSMGSSMSKTSLVGVLAVTLSLSLII